MKRKAINDQKEILKLLSSRYEELLYDLTDPLIFNYTFQTSEEMEINGIKHTLTLINVDEIEIEDEFRDEDNSDFEIGYSGNIVFKREELHIFELPTLKLIIEIEEK